MKLSNTLKWFRFSKFKKDAWQTGARSSCGMVPLTLLVWMDKRSRLWDWCSPEFKQVSTETCLRSASFL